MMKKLCAPLLAMMVLAMICGCGEASSDKARKGPPAAPSHAGDPEALVGTSWVDSESNTTYTFKDATTVVVENPAAEKPLTGSYGLEKGVINLSIGLRSLEGTWDGTALTVKGKKLTKK